MHLSISLYARSMHSPQILGSRVRLWPSAAYPGFLHFIRLHLILCFLGRHRSHLWVSSADSFLPDEMHNVTQGQHAGRKALRTGPVGSFRSCNVAAHMYRFAPWLLVKLSILRRNLIHTAIKWQVVLLSTPHANGNMLFIPS